MFCNEKYTLRKLKIYFIKQYIYSYHIHNTICNCALVFNNTETTDCFLHTQGKGIGRGGGTTVHAVDRFIFAVFN